MICITRALDFPLNCDLPNRYRSMTIKWLKPVIDKGVISWPQSCVANVKTTETVSRLTAMGVSLRCFNSAKVDFNGSPMCVRHARVAALDFLIGAAPTPTVKDVKS